MSPSHRSSSAGGSLFQHGSPNQLEGVLAPRSRSHQGPYGRLFRDLPPHVPRVRPTQRRDRVSSSGHETVEDAIHLRAASLVDGSQAPTRRNDRIPAGYAFLGQFLAHDLTFDPTSLAQRIGDPERLQNFRTPRLDLDLVYGGGPRVTPYAHGWEEQRQDSDAFRRSFLKDERYQDYLLCYDLRTEGRGDKQGEEDLPRLRSGRAVIPDPRNDSHLVIGQLHLAFMKFHNRALWTAVERGFEDEDAFLEAQRLTRWHYQWVIVHDYLKRVTGSFRQWVEPLLQGNRRFFDWRDRPFIPVEFSAAAFRFGHAMLLPKYAINGAQDELPLFGETSLQGFRELPVQHTIAWDRFVGTSNGARRSEHLQGTRLLQPSIADGVDTLPAEIFGQPGLPSLVERDLLRSYSLRLPSGQAVARRVGDPRSDVTGDDSLWYYVLKEANTIGRGRHLGPVGATIVAEVLIGLLKGDPGSYLCQDPKWRPELGRRGRDFDLAEFLRVADMPMSDEQLPWHEERGVVRSQPRKAKSDAPRRTAPKKHTRSK